MGGLSCLKEPLKTAPKTPQPQVLNMRYLVSNRATEKTFIMSFTDEELNTVERMLSALVDLGYDLNYLEIVPKNIKKIKINSKNT